jgi:hypothetical protein
LIETVHPSDRGPHSYREIAAGTADHPGAITDRRAHHPARQRQATAPKDPLRQALASFSGVPVTYFFDDHAAARINDQITQVKAWRATEVRHIAERVVELKPATATPSRT